MSKLLLLITMAIMLNSCNNQPKAPKTNTEASDIAAYDSTLAARLGADDYGMKRYVMAFLKTGTNRDHDSATVAGIQAGHMAHMRQMAEDGKLIMAGPFLDRGEVRGIFIFNTGMEEAEALTSADPAVQSGRLVMELHPWYGSAALLELTELHKKVQKKSI